MRPVWMLAPTSRLRSSSRRSRLRGTGGPAAALLLAPLVLWFGQPIARAQGDEVLRVALLIANNEGNGSRAPLRYAQDDAGAVAKVLIELGGFGRDDVHL